MATYSRPPVGDDLSNISFGNVHHHQGQPTDPPHTGSTVPMPSTFSPTPSVANLHSGQPSPSLGYAIENLPQETISYSAGIPLLPHYLAMQDAEVDTCSRFYVPAAASSINVAQNEVLGFRRDELLGIFDDSFPTESERLGTPHTINSSVYDFFTGMKKRVANTILGSRVTFTSPAGVPTTGYFIQPRDYHLLYNILNGYKNLYEKVVLELAGLPLVLPKWARNDIPAQVWTAGKFELFAVKYREELETFLHLCYTYRHTMGAQLPPSNPQVKS